MNTRRTLWLAALAFIVAAAAGCGKKTTADATLGTIITRGVVRNVLCSGTVTQGDLLEVNNSSVAVTAAVPAVGAVLGKALTACSAGHLTAMVSVG